MQRRRRYYFSTRDLLMMAALAALGGVASTYIQTLANAVHAALGFPGTMQILAGLHVIWLVLAVGLTGKQGAGTFTGIVKGGVEFLSGNTHGILIVLIDVVAGVLVDLGMLPFRDKNSNIAYSVAGGLAAASNVFVFQFFASVPSDILAMSAVLLVGIVSFVSGVLLAGVLGRVLLNALRRAGVVKDQPVHEMGRWVFPALLAIVSALALTAGIYLYYALQGPPEVDISGQVSEPYAYRYAEQDEAQLTTIRETAKPGLIGTYIGLPLREIIQRAEPTEEATSVLVRGSDGYDFFIQMAEVEENEELILAQSGTGGDLTYSVVGAKNSKAWVRNVVQLVVVGRSVVEVVGALDSPRPYDPDQWQFDMDNARLDLGYGARKYQGVSLGIVLEAMQPQPQSSTVTMISRLGKRRDLELIQVIADESIRLFNVTSDQGLTFTVASESGEIWLKDVVEIKVS